MTTVANLKRRCYPNCSTDGTASFYNWLRLHLHTEYSAVNVGAGPASSSNLLSMKGEVKRVVGVDIDRAVIENSDLDEALVVPERGTWPLSDNSFDIGWSDFVFEHVLHPAEFLAEIYRVLKPGAYFFFRTPNRYHYVALISRMTPYWFHRRFANKVRALPGAAHDPYPTHYRLNGRKEIVQLAHQAGFREVELRFVEAEPSYLVFHAAPFIAGILYERIVNRYEALSGLRAAIFGRLQK